MITTSLILLVIIVILCYIAKSTSISFSDKYACEILLLISLALMGLLCIISFNISLGILSGGLFLWELIRSLS